VAGLLACAIDGTIMSVADSAANLAVYSKQRGGRNGDSGYPRLRLLALVSCGTRTVIDAVSGPVSSGETTYAPDLLAGLRAGMLLLADRGFAAGFLAARIAKAEADFLIRVRTGNGAPKLPVLRRLPDGSWLSLFGGVSVRVIDVEITATTSSGQSRDGCRLIATLTDPARCPARDLPVLYHERWQIETACLELKSTIPGGRVLRVRTPDGIEQEVWALLVSARRCAPPSPTPPTPSPASVPAAPASPSPSTPPATRSSGPQASSPAPAPTWPRRSAASSWPASCPQAAAHQPPRRQTRHVQV
jgi:hypothetical protein